MIVDTIERARNRWREILPQLGVETRFLTNKHGPCPNCGGKDRFRFDDKNGEGTYYCNQCGPGSGLLLVRKLRGWDHATACREVDRIIGNGAAPRPAQNQKNTGDKAAAIQRILHEACYPGVVAAYLRRRGISVTSAVLRGHWRCPYYDGPRRIGTFPAVLAPIRDASGKLQSVQRIYTTTDLNGLPRKKTMSPIDTVSGCAVQLFETTDELGVAEGIETSLAAYQLFKIPTWAALSENGLKTFQPPPGVAGIHVFADNDANYVGQEAAFALARRLIRDGLAAEVHIPDRVGDDWNDVLSGRSA